MASENYVVTVAAFGQYARDNVLPGYVITAGGHDIARLVEGGVIAKTTAAVNVTLAIPEKTAPDVSAEVILSHQNLQVEVDSLRAENQALRATCDELTRQRKMLDVSLSEQVTEIGRLKDLLQAAETEKKALEDALDEATKPPVK